MRKSRRDFAKFILGGYFYIDLSFDVIFFTVIFLTFLLSLFSLILLLPSFSISSFHSQYFSARRTVVSQDGIEHARQGYFTSLLGMYKLF
jgi:uncharacterized membrane protein